MINLVHVIVLCGGILDAVYTYSDDEAGNKKAEKKFEGIIRELYSGVTDKEIAYCMDEGYYEGTHSDVWITHNIKE